eukprot:jgi/Psemu1/68058/estExt_Genemark1.C_4240031
MLTKYKFKDSSPMNCESTALRAGDAMFCDCFAGSVAPDATSTCEPDPPTSYDSASTCAFDDALADTETPAICNVTYFNTPTETFQACCTSDTTVPSSAEPGSVCVLSSAPSSGAWTVTVLAAVATTVAAALTGF